MDDEESNLRVFDSVFSRYYNIYTANNGNTAINMLREHNIHMIITDQKMPEMTGTDLLESILEEFPDIIRIILTGFADIQAIRHEDEFFYVRAGTPTFMADGQRKTIGPGGFILLPRNSTHAVWNRGDDISITVTNNLDAPTTTHWHGAHVSTSA